MVSEKTKVIVAQNGYGNYEIVSEEIGKEHTLLARVIFGSKIIKPGFAEVTVNADDVRIGDPSGTIPEEEIIKIACIIKMLVYQHHTIQMFIRHYGIRYFTTVH